jgi:hypothetical protein
MRMWKRLRMVGGQGQSQGRGVALPTVAALAGLVALLLPLGIWGAGRAHAQAQQDRVAGNASAGHVTILVLDMSGSMGRPGQGGNDPNGLRCSAAHAYIDLSGVGQWIGIVGLTHPLGAPGDITTAQDYAQPAEMTTDAARAAMWHALATRSNNCVGNGWTPMADALARADRMLHAATKGGSLSGSVILLTDGLPDPNPTSQIAAFQRQLPDFQAHTWPIDTIALGDADRTFLRGLADATGGTAYDVANGPVPGVSALNLEPFFVDIFRINEQRTLLHAVAPLTIGGTTARQFHVGRFIAHMDVLVVRDSNNVGAQLYAPGNYPSSPEQPGQARIVDTDPHYEIFSIDTPIRGDWVLAFSGAGQLLVDALLQSTLSLQLISPTANQHLPVGLAIGLDASLRDGTDQILAEPVALSATLAPANGADRTGREVQLTDPGGSSPTGNYQGRVTVPSGAPRGTYYVNLSALLNDAQVSLSVPVVFEAFPVPTLLSPSTGAPQLGGLAVDDVPGGPLSVSFGLTVDGKLQAEPNVSATLLASGQPLSLSTFAGTWQGTYIPSASGAQPLVVRLAGTFHGTDLRIWPYTLPLNVTLRPSLGVSGIDVRRPYPAYRTLTVTMAYFRRAGVPDPNDAGHITAMLLPPNGIGVPVALQPLVGTDGRIVPGAYTVALPFGAPGSYTLHAVFDDGVPADHSEQLFVLRVIDFPTAVAAPMAPGQTLTDWGAVLGGLYGLPVIGWLQSPPLSGTPNQPTAVVAGQVTLAGHPYTNGTLRAAAYALGSDRPLPAEVSRDGAAFTVRFNPPSPGAYRVVVTWVGDFAGLRADQEPTTVSLQLAIVGPTAGEWIRAWLLTLVYLILLALLTQLGRFSATPAPAGALQASDNQDNLYYLDQHHAPLWRRYLWRNRVRTADLGLPAGAELRFRRYRTPLVIADPRAGAGSVLVSGTALEPSAPPMDLEGATLTFRQPDLGLEDDEADGAGRRAERDGPSARRARGGEELASHYVYLSPAELRQRTERDDPWAGLNAAAEERAELDGEGNVRPLSLLGHVGALLGMLRPLPRGHVDEDDGLGELWDLEREPRPRRGRGAGRSADPLEDLDLNGAGSGRGARRGRARDLDDLELLDSGGRARARRRGSTSAVDDDLYGADQRERPRRSRRQLDDDLY